ncbi:MAG: hypothetical protein KAS94_12700 [Desulfobulbaceae bacterium]|nr:hypothetical protein [Desulfobulbaceae bacterium]
MSEKEILSYLNTALHKAGHHEDCHFESVVRLRVDDRTGCNWAYANLKGMAGASKVCPVDAEKIVNKARAGFNLK